MRLPDLPTPLLSKAALKRSGVWQEMMADIWQCRTARELLRCQLVWSATISKWPADDELGWAAPAMEEFEKARMIIEATEKENGNGTPQALWW